MSFYSSPLLVVILYPSVVDMGLRPQSFHPPEATEVLVVNGCTQIQKAALILLITSCCTASFSAGAASNTLVRLHAAAKKCKVWVQVCWLDPTTRLNITLMLISCAHMVVVVSCVFTVLLKNISSATESMWPLTERFFPHGMKYQLPDQGQRAASAAAPAPAPPSPSTSLD